MRMSCNGCRVLRKGCSEDCSIRPCLQWIKSPDSQAHATVFLAKFYGRAGLMNLINAGPEHIRPAIFRSLLYEACGRIVNPIYGSVGLLWSGQWQLCQTAVENVLKGDPITPIATDAAVAPPPNKAYDIRHVIKDEASNNNNNSAAELHRVKPTRTRFKRAGVSKPKQPKPAKASSAPAAANAVALSMMPGTPESTRNDAAGSSTSHGSSVSHADEATMDTSMVSVDTAEVEPVADADVEERENGGDGEVELELTLGFGFDPVQRSRSSEPKSWAASRASDDSACNKIAELGLI